MPPLLILRRHLEIRFQRCSQTIAMTPAFRPLATHTHVLSTNSSPVGEVHEWCSGQEGPLFPHPKSSQYLGFGQFYSYTEVDSWGSCGPQPFIPGMWLQGRDAGCRRHCCGQFLAGFQATSVLQLSSRETTLPHHCPLIGTVTVRCSGLPCGARLPDGGSLNNICQPRWKVCFLAGRAIWGHWVEPLSGSGWSFFFPIVYCVWKIKHLAAPGPGRVWSADSPWRMARQGQGPMRLKGTAFRSMARGSCSVFKLVSWWGQLPDKTQSTASMGRRHHVQQQVGVSAFDFGHVSLLSHQDIIYKMGRSCNLLY